jgi:8-oxo-dGTP pyrophosphatase MutT (NUDIX family)
VTSLGGDQIIPRPPGALPGGPAPWASLDPQRRKGLSIERVVAALKLHMDTAALEPQADPAPPPSVSVLPELLLQAQRAPSAVLVAMFEESGETRVILTRRSKALRFHQGEVSFPGGRCDPGESLTECALREAREETGLDPDGVSVVGQLSPLATFSSQSLVTPVVGVLDSRPSVRANPTEVDRVLDVSLAMLASDRVFREERWRLADRPGFGRRSPVTRSEGTGSRDPASVGPASVGAASVGAASVGPASFGVGEGWYPVWFFELPGDTVWGATARILVELLTAVL